MKIYYFTLLLTSLIMSSCTSVYTPTQAMPTGFKKAQDVNASIGAGLRGVRANLAYTPVNHFYINGAYTSMTSNNGRDHNKGYQYGIGTYWPTQKFSIEADFGLGKGSFLDGTGTFDFGPGDYEFVYAEGQYDQLTGTISITFETKNRVSHGAIARYSQIGLSYSEGYHKFRNTILYNNKYNSEQIGVLYFAKKYTDFGLYLMGQAGIYSSLKFPHPPINPLFLRFSLGYQFRYKKQNSNKFYGD